MLDQPHSKSKEHLLDDEIQTPAFTPSSNSNKIVIRKLSCVFLLSMTFMIIEIIGGILSNSLAILADAGHLFSDLLGFLISIISVWISAMPADVKHSFGYHRAGVIGALASVMIIWGLTGFLVYYAVQRVINIDTIHVEGKIMFFTACFGLLTNITMIKVLNWESEMTEATKPEVQNNSKQISRKATGTEDMTTRLTQAEPADNIDQVEDRECQNQLYSPPKVEEFNDEQLTFKIRLTEADVEANKTDEEKEVQTIKENFNIRATIIHIIGDMIQSIGVILAAGLIWVNPSLKIADPIITFIFSVIVMITTIRIVRDCIRVLMEATPSHINIEEFKEKLKSVQGVIGIHDFHIWSLSEDKPSMSAHIYTNMDQQIVLKKATKICRLYGIYHSTIQIETIVDSKHHHYVNCGHDLH